MTPGTRSRTGLLLLCAGLLSAHARDVVAQRFRQPARHPATAAAPVHGAQGIFVYAEQPASSPTQFDQALGVPGVDGMAMVLDWSAVNPGNGTYDFSTVDWQLREAKTHHLPIELVIRAGRSVPAWLLGATSLHLAYAPHAGKGKCSPVDMPPPWEDAYQTAFRRVLDTTAAYLKAHGADLAVVKLTGLNATTEELRLPAESRAQTSKCPSGGTDDVMAWRRAHYRPDLLGLAFQQVTASYATVFPNTPVTLAIIPHGAFPPINDSGRVVRGRKKKQLNDQVLGALVAAAAQALPGRFILQFDFLLAGRPADSMTMALARANDLPVAWQTNLWLGGKGMGAACHGPMSSATGCTDQEYLSLLEEGIHPASGAGPSAEGRYIEVFPYDAVNHCPAIETAHLELMHARGPMPACPAPRPAGKPPCRTPQQCCLASGGTWNGRRCQ